ncbi:hypothetical protein PoB_006770600 [Plakobranchus ocellatus]|uniref:Uncharacterized protein n=1 Tax=Plakobranchus ocellatus TaxID=259542 RepID=A0AAV4DAM6_9GAST|nr:hypothetical protein PoB_006770600 [Plakobranchus ocellatus]
MVLVHEVRDHSSFVLKFLKIDQGALMLEPPSLNASVNVRFGVSSLELFKLNYTFGNEPRIPKTWRIAEDRASMDDVFRECTWAVILIPLVIFIICVMVAITVVKERYVSTRRTSNFLSFLQRYMFRN